MLKEYVQCTTKMSRLLMNSKRRFLVVGMITLGTMLILWHQWRHVSKTEGERASTQNTQNIHFRPNDSEKYEKCDKAFLPDSAAMSQSGYNIPVTPYNTLDKFTVLTMVFNRLQSYREVIQHYMCMPFVDRVVLLWANQEVDPPTRELINVNCSKKLFVHSLKSSDLTRRFANFPEIQTDAVFNVDDDKLLPAGDLQRAFKVWKKYPWGIVGYEDRCCDGIAPNLTYGPDRKSWSYRLILTSAAFFHREYLRLFDEKCPAEVRADIDRNKNCEDILMNFLVREHCKCSGVIYVGSGHIRPPKKIKYSAALSSRPNHYIHRTGCVRKYVNLYSKTVNFTSSKCVYRPN